MKRILIASAVAFAAGGQALAADLPPPMAPPPRAPAMYVPVVPLYNWTGFYIGGNVGAGWNSTGSITDNLTPASTFGTTTNTSFLGGGQIGVNYEFGGGVVVGAEAMFDWLPNTSNTINATNGNRYCRSYNQQSMADDRDRQARLRLGSRASLWQGRRRLGRHQQSIDLRSIRRTGALVRHQQQQQLRLDRWSWRRMGFRGQLVGASRVGLRPAAESELYSRCRDTAVFAGDVISVNNRSINMFTAGLNYKFGGGWW